MVGEILPTVYLVSLIHADSTRAGCLLSDLAVYVAQDCSVYKEDDINLCCTADDQPPASSLDITVHDFQIIGIRVFIFLN